MKRTLVQRLGGKLRRIQQRLRGVGRKYAWVKAEEIPFVSGLGDSAWLLYGLARSMKPETCVEIGSARGKSACYVGLALRDNGRGRLYAIDPHAPTNWNDSDSVDSFEIFRQNITWVGVGDRIEMIRTTSDEAARGWNRPIDLLFIDGDHSYEGVKRDWELFSPFLSPFGVAMFHDTGWDLEANAAQSREDMGVPRFVDELRAEGYPVLTIDKDYGVSIVQGIRGGVPLRHQSSVAAG